MRRCLEANRNAKGLILAKLFRGAATAGEARQGATLRAGTLRVRIIGRSRVAAGHADERLLRPPRHGPELAALHTVGAAHHLCEHSYSISFPPRLGHRVDCGPMLLAGGLGRGGAERNQVSAPGDILRRVNAG